MSLDRRQRRMGRTEQVHRSRSKKERFVGSLSLRTLVGMAERGDFRVYFYVVRAGNVD